MKQKIDNENDEQKQESLLNGDNNEEILDFDVIREKMVSTEANNKQDLATSEDEKEKSATIEKKEEKKEESEKTTTIEKKEEKKEESKKPSTIEKKEEKKEESEKLSTIDKKEEKKEESEKSSTIEKKKQKMEDGNKSSVKKKVCVGAICSFAILLVAGYLFGVFYFSGHFYKEVKVNGVDVSKLEIASARQRMEDFYSNYELTIKLIDDSEKRIHANDIAMNIVLKEDISYFYKQQKPFLWFINYFTPYEFTMSTDVEWDKNLLSNLFEDWSIFNQSDMKKPKDAYVGVVEGKFSIIEEENGTTIYVNEAKNEIEQALTEVVSSINLVEKSCYLLPKVKKDNEALQTELEAKSKYSENEIKLKLDDLVLEPGMGLYDQILELKGNDYIVSESKVKQFVTALARQYDTYGSDRQFTTSWNHRKIFTHGEKFGYLMNQEETTKALIDALNAKKPFTVEVVFDQKGNTLQGENDIGDTYIEVNLSEQHVYAYKDGKKIAEGDCVSGNESVGHGTCIGLYAIQNKLSPTVLRGERKAVTKTIKKKVKGKMVSVQQTSYQYEYESPVTYWMQFNGGIGLHDAAGWRSAYGGSIYYYSGSHGCVNLPLDFAKQLYENFDIDTPVVVYFWDNENRK